MDGDGQRFDEARVARRQSGRQGDDRRFGDDALFGHAAIDADADDHGRAAHAPVIVAVAAGVALPARIEGLDSDRCAVAQVAGELVAERCLERPHGDEVQIGPTDAGARDLDPHALARGRGDRHDSCLILDAPHSFHAAQPTL